ncbi:DUF924 family protein [Nannocystaceae bacterium ST9]
MVDPETVLTTWFPSDPAQQQKLWWGKDEATDASLRERFADTLAAARRGELEGWAASARGRLALILVLDQLSRNIHRGSPEAFVGDPLARALTHAGLALGHDRELAPIERVFMYLPLEHSEELGEQDQCVGLFKALADEVAAGDPEQGKRYAYYLTFADRHREIIARFGRFPHRNAVLGRASTAEELAFLSEPGSSF